jgi:hypothetical protein
VFDPHGAHELGVCPDRRCNRGLGEAFLAATVEEQRRIVRRCARRCISEQREERRGMLRNAARLVLRRGRYA